MAAVKISDIKVGDVVFYRVSGSPNDKRVSTARVTSIDAATKRVNLTRRTGNSVHHMTIPVSRVIGFHIEGTPF